MSKRHERLTELFLHEITQGLRDVPRLNEDGLLTITGAHLSGEDETLTVYYSVYGTPQQAASKARILAANARELRTLLFKRLRLKAIPVIVFEFDETPKNAARIEDLLSKIHSEQKPKDENPRP